MLEDWELKYSTVGRNIIALLDKKKVLIALLDVCIISLAPSIPQ